MELLKVFHMKGGTGESSYANNSSVQKKVISTAMPITMEAITRFYAKASPAKLAIADLGCSSSPNTLFTVLEIIKAVQNLCVPGSFYGRLFPTKSLQFVHSANSLHWLSKVPEGLEDNMENIYIARTSPPNVLNAYYKQFCEDFRRFLDCRAEELVSGGGMVLSLTGRKSSDHSKGECYSIWEPLASALSKMVSEGLIEED
ncbi:hypothetical protein MLD38_028642 [Melastoma candidum]|uniref:Uncharacterized protein n=1 Tax=Melastoma candidum TaxID=119954 RepID=A0ACB9N1J6_9MYRT|nr:hypothetical protein MLD38_028642 [Melastoma candidum]